MERKEKSRMSDDEATGKEDCVEKSGEYAGDLELFP